MLTSFFKKLKRDSPRKPLFSQSSPADLESRPINHSLPDNRRVLDNCFTNCIDVIYREFVIGEEQLPALLIFIDGLANKSIINENIMESLMEIQYSPVETSNSASPIEMIKKVFLQMGEVKELLTIGEMVDAVLIGETIFLLDRTTIALSLGTKGWESRGVSEPVTEGVVRGPREGFTETLRTNTALLRRRVKVSQLKLERYILGRTTKTEVNIAYLEGTVDNEIVKEVRKRIERIDVDSILESAYIEELIEDTPYTLFPQIEHSERPDKVAAAILEGRVAILIDGTPFTLLVPTIMAQFLQSSEDYYERYPFAFMVRMVRFIFSGIAHLLPGTYVAVTTFHQEMLPTSLLISITGAHEGVPFPAVVEAFMMEVTFEALREAGVRLPRPVGQAVSIVGALVIGEAAVQAGIVSPAMVIVVALTGIASFCIPSYNLALAIRIMRFIFIILGATLGLYGIMLGMLMMLIHLTSLRSFGVPYLSPLAPFKLQDLKDSFVRFPWWAMGERPNSIPLNNRRRQKFFLKPHPPENNDL